MATTLAKPDDTAARKFAAALLRLARKTPGKMDAYLCCAEDSCLIAATKTTLRSHVIRQDAHGNVRVDALVERLAHVVVDYAIPRSRISSANESYRETRSTQAFMALREEAIELFTPSPTSGEGGELLLFWLTENVLGFPQILCKMPLKTNPNVHYHGVDGVHALPADNGELAVIWGESKLHQKVNRAITECFKSLGPFVTGQVGGNAARRDLALLRDNVDLDDRDLEASLKNYLQRDHTQNLQLKYRGVCLVGFDEDPYPKADHAMTTSTLRAAMKASLNAWKSEVGKAVKANHVDAIDIDIFLVPMPSVCDFRDALKSKLGLS